MTNAKEFGWWLESTDENFYGPVTLVTLAQFQADGVVSANTSVRHCTETEWFPLAELNLLDEGASGSNLRTGDNLAQAWPRRTADRLALGEAEVDCAYHARPAIATCIRCLAPYCSKCQMKGKGKIYYMCKKCNNSMFNRRFGAYMMDGLLINLIPGYGVAIPAVMMAGPEKGQVIANLVGLLTTVVFMFRDSVLGGAGPGKRALGLRVVSSRDGSSPLGHGQAFLRWLGHMICLFNLFDANRAYTDPLQRRYADGWAGTRVLDTEEKLAAHRAKIAGRLESKGILFQVDDVMTLQQFAQLTE